jgi:hypothetical protein
MQNWFGSFISNFQKNVNQLYFKIRSFSYLHHKKILVVLAFIGLVIVFNEWFLGKGILSYSDWLYIYPESFSSFTLYPSAWISNQFGGVNIFSYFNPINIAHIFLNVVGFEYAQIERILFMIPSITFSYWGMYFLAKKITNKTYPSIISALLFVLNSYVIVISTSHLTLLVALSFIPTVFYLIYDFFDTNKIFALFFASFLLAAMSWYEFRIFYLATLLIVVLFAFELYTSKWSLKNLLRLILAGIIVFSVPIITNFYWIYALSFSGSISSNVIFDRALFGDAFLNIEKSITLAHPFWNGKSIVAFSVQSTPILHWILPLFAFTGLYLGRKNSKVLYFGLITLAGVFLTKQSGTPFTQVYLWLFEHFPGFNSFREASKFYILIMLGYPILIGFFLSWISEQKQYKYYKVAAYFSLLLLSATFALPILTKNIGTLFVERTIPDEYIKLNQTLLSTSDQFKTLWVPRRSKWSLYNSSHTFVSFDEVILEKCDSLVPESSKSGTLSSIMLNCISAEDFPEFLSQASIKYIVVPKKDTDNDDDFFQYYAEREIFVEALSLVDSIKKVELDLGVIDVFENNAYFQTIQFGETAENEKISFTKIAPDFYSLNIDVANTTKTIFFSQNFHPFWELQSTDGEKIPYIHEKSKYGLNIFTLDIESICKNISCKRQDDGSFSLDLNIKFIQQKKFDEGLQISFLLAAVWFALLIWFIALKIRIKNKK